MDGNISIDFGQVAKEIDLPIEKVRSTVALLDDGNTVPFITRYRKDQTGGLDEEQIRRIERHVSKLRALAERKATILKSIESQGKLTDRLAEQIIAARSPKWLEDLYLPYKPKKQTLASIARQRGLEPLAREIFAADRIAADLALRAADFMSSDKDLHSLADVLQGVSHLLAERFSEQAELRGRLRKILWRSGNLVCTKIEAPGKPEQTKPSPAEPASADASGDDSATQDTATSPPDSPADTPVADVAIQADSSPANDESPSPDGSPSGSPTAGQTVAEQAVGGNLANGTTPVEQPPETTSPSQQVTSKQSREAVSAQTDEKNSIEVSPVKPPAGLTAAKKSKKQIQKEKLQNAFHDYFNYREPLSRIPPHRILAINRGERAKVLRVRMEADDEEIGKQAEQLLVPSDHPHAELLRQCVRDALSRLVLPALQREIRRELTDRAEDHAVEVFAQNLRKLLLQPPVHGRRVLAIDPGYRSGCKLAALDEFGNLLANAVIHVVGKEDRRTAGRAKLVEMISRHEATVVAIGNGAACRQTEQLVGEIIADELKDREISYVIVNEAGASVYSTSALGREEMPECDAVQRSAVSIGRRLLDPLSELVKINAANIGVGMYQHDVKSKHLENSLDDVVESCVNFVGVDVNSASPALLRYVSGLNQLTARRLYEHRCQHGPFRNREQFREVAGFGEAAFVQAAGFLKISGGDNPLEATWIHPESYGYALRVIEQLGGSVDELAAKPLTRPVAQPQRREHADVADSDGSTPGESAPNVASVAATGEDGSAKQAADARTQGTPSAEAGSPQSNVQAPSMLLGLPPDTVTSNGGSSRLAQQAATANVDQLALEVGVGEQLLKDILASLIRPGRDPREDFPPPVFRRGVLKMEDLQPGMELSGSVLNVVDFGAFVDIGLGDSGLVHISRLADRYVSDPHEVVSVGEVLKVWVVEVDKQRRRVSLTAIQPGTEKQHRPRREKRSEGPKGRRRPTVQKSGSSTPVKGQRGGKRVRPPKFQGSARRKQKPKPVTPITEGMVEGTEPMRSFSDLMQFFDKKPDDSADDTDSKAQN